MFHPTIRPLHLIAKVALDIIAKVWIIALQCTTACNIIACSPMHKLHPVYCSCILDQIICIQKLVRAGSALDKEMLASCRRDCKTILQLQLWKRHWNCENTREVTGLSPLCNNTFPFYIAMSRVDAIVISVLCCKDHTAQNIFVTLSQLNVSASERTINIRLKLWRAGKSASSYSITAFNEPAKVLFEQLICLKTEKCICRYPVTILYQCCWVFSYCVDFLAYALSC